MRKYNLINKLRRAVVIVGILTIASTVTACGGTTTEPVSSTAIESTEETKDFSMNLSEETLSSKELEVYQSAANEVLENTGLLEDSSVVTEQEADWEESKQIIKDSILSGETNIARLGEMVDVMLMDATDEYKDKAKSEIEQAYTEKFVSSSTEEGIQAPTAPETTPAQTNTAKSETKSASQPTQPLHQTESQPTQPVPQPTQNDQTSSDQIYDSSLTPDQLAEMERLTNEGVREWQDSDAYNQHVMTDEEMRSEMH